MSLRPTCDVFILAGEASGDAYAGAVAAELRRRRPGLTIAAMGGEHLAAAGAEIEQPIDGLAVMGLLPVLARLPQFIRLGMRMQRLIAARQPAVVISVDYPGFNLRLARRLAGARRAGMAWIHVVAPQVWAWKPRRAKRIAASVDRLLCFFPFEPPLFERFGCRAGFVGHPLVDLVAAEDPAPIRRELGLAPGQRLLVLAPGSREREVAGLLPTMHQAAEAIVRRHPGAAVAVSRVADVPLERYRRATHFPLIEGRFRALCAAGHAGLVASGTASLEAALIGLPHLITYRMDAPSAMLARHLIRTAHIGLPNIVLGRRAVPEVLQGEFTAPRLVAHLDRLWDGPRRADLAADLIAVRSALGGGGALGRIADAVEAELSRARDARGRSHASQRLKTGTEHR